MMMVMMMMMMMTSNKQGMAPRKNLLPFNLIHSKLQPQMLIVDSIAKRLWL